MHKGLPVLENKEEFDISQIWSYEVRKDNRYKRYTLYILGEHGGS